MQNQNQNDRLICPIVDDLQTCLLVRLTVFYGFPDCPTRLFHSVQLELSGFQSINLDIQTNRRRAQIAGMPSVTRYGNDTSSVLQQVNHDRSY